MDCRSSTSFAAWAWALSFAAACANEGGTHENRGGTCVAPPRPELDETIAFERTFPAIDLEDGVALTHLPGDDSRWYVVTKPGIVYTFAANDGDPEVFVDLASRVAVAGEAGLLGIAFHPDFADNGEVFLSYTAPGSIPFRSVIARLVSRDGGRTLDPDSLSEVLTIEQPFENHNGGDLHFGTDGLLYAGFGDGGSSGDPLQSGQDTNSLLGKMLRIDVDVAEPYGIPADNPFAGGGGAPEIFAWGLRNPWRFAVDRKTGELWVGDVGQNLWEEVDLVERGGNYGWSLREGAECFGRTTCDDAIAPVAQYRNTGAASVIGGAVYRGRELPGLDGAFVYSDFYRGTVYAVRVGEDAQVLHRSGGRRIAGWAEDDDGELYGLDHDGGIYRVVAAEPTGDDPFPRTLVASGCVRVDEPTLPIAELIPYEVNEAFWSDGADKARFLAVPSGTIDVGADGDFDLPVGSVLLKSFAREGLPIETRLLVRHDDGAWAGYSYAWREDGSDAELVVDARTVDRGGGPWVYPAIEDCTYCHSEAAGGSLGLETSQLARIVDDGAGQSIDQLDHFIALGLLRERPSGNPLPDAGAPLDDRARAYLHVNCSQCHRPDGPSGRARLDLRVQTTLAESGLCEDPRTGDIDLTDPRIVAPGVPDSSVLLARVRSLGGVRMPPVASLAVDEAGADLLEAWINALTSCP